MKTQTILVALVALVVFAFPANETQAATATMINDTTVLMTLGFSFTAVGGDYEIPVIASSTVVNLDRVDVLGYELSGAKVSSVQALVLSNNPLNGVRYGIDAEQTANFTLFIIATLEEPLTDTLTASITKIPYWVDGVRTTVHQNQLDELSTASTD